MFHLYGFSIVLGKWQIQFCFPKLFWNIFPDIFHFHMVESVDAKYTDTKNQQSISVKFVLIKQKTQISKKKKFLKYSQNKRCLLIQDSSNRS